MGPDLPDQRCIDGGCISVNTISKATMELIAGLFTRYKRCNLEKEIAKYKLNTLPIELLREAKIHGLQ